MTGHGADVGRAPEVFGQSPLKPQAADYQYSELRLQRSIRLLHLQSGAFNDEIKCSLHSANLDESPLYSALSYTWGDSHDTVPITCDDHRFNVTVNLAGALRRLRSIDSLVIIWVDAICIDQTNIDERNSQVRLMKDIFSQAIWVTVYLGEETEDTPLALDLLKLLYELSKLTDRKATEEKLKTGYMRGSDPEIPQSFSPHWDALQNFFRREYFSRIWVVQEVALSSSDPIVLLGEHRMTWDLIYHATAIYHTSEISRFRPGGDQSFNALLMQDYRLMNVQGNTKSWTLLRLLGHTRGFRATDPRDKIFALHGLANDMYDRNGSAIFEPDYHASLGDVCHDVAQRLIVDRGVIDVLSYCTPSSAGVTTELPSWAPDWTLRQTVTILGTGLQSSGFEASSKFTKHAQLSSNNRVLEVHGSIIDIVSSVFRPVEHQFDIPSEFRVPGVLKRIWDEVVMLLGENYVTGGSTVDAFWRTLIANLDINVQSVPDDYYIHFLSYWRLVRLSDVLCEEYRQNHSSRPSINDYDAITAAMKNDFQSDFTNTDELAAIKRRMEAALSERGIVCTKVNKQSQPDISCEHCEFLNRFDEFRASNPVLGPVREDDPSLNMMDDTFIADWFRRLRGDEEDPIHVLDSSGNTYSTCILGGVYQRSFIVTSGKLIGIAPANTQVGDKVAIIAGAQMPFILRPRKETSPEDAVQFTLVGEAYVHGVMDGSFVKVDGKGDPLWHTIGLI